MSDTLNEWKVRGARAWLPGGVSLAAPWTILSSGDVSGTIKTANGWARVRFAKWPEWEFVFPIPDGGHAGTLPLPEGRDAIPADARADHLMIRVNTG